MVVALQESLSALLVHVCSEIKRDSHQYSPRDAHNWWCVRDCMGVAKGDCHIAGTYHVCTQAVLTHRRHSVQVP